MSHVFSLEDRVAIVTGAARGIGAAITERFLKAGARVALAELDAAEARKLAQKLDPSGQRTLVVEVDITKEAQVQAMAGQVQHLWGTIQILVNNAGIAGPNKPLVDVSEEEWDHVSNVNLKGVFL